MKIKNILIHLGEVECGFVFWWRKIYKKEDIQQSVKKSINSYSIFIDNIARISSFNICLTGASLPTITDYSVGDIQNKRKEVAHVPILEKTKLTLQYTKLLSDLARNKKISFFDISNALIDCRTGCVHKYFINPDPHDHHLDKIKVAPIWALECNRFLSSNGQYFSQMPYSSKKYSLLTWIKRSVF